MTGSLGPSFDPARLDAIRSSMAGGPSASASVPAKTAGPRLWQRAAVLIAGFAALLYLIELADVLKNNQLDNLGIEPRSADGLWGIAFAPMLHGGWDHLIGNTLPLLVLGFLALMAGIARGLAATAIIWIVGGAGTWLTGQSGSVHLGASVLIFGWLTYLILRGLFTRSATQILIGLAVLVVYGGLLWGVLPNDPRISWQGHLFGAIGGLIAAWMLSSDEREARKQRALKAA